MKALAFAALLALPLPVCAETREERVAAAREYVDLALAGFDMAAMITRPLSVTEQFKQVAGQFLLDTSVSGDPFTAGLSRNR